MIQKCHVESMLFNTIMTSHVIYGDICHHTHNSHNIEYQGAATASSGFYFVKEITPSCSRSRGNPTAIFD